MKAKKIKNKSQQKQHLKILHSTICEDNQQTN